MKFNSNGMQLADSTIKEPHLILNCNSCTNSSMFQKSENNDYSLLRLQSVSTDVTMVGQIQACQQTNVMCLDIPLLFGRQYTNCSLSREE